ncbi:hypothetical protein FANTH_4011 [Fusarium anthophilum]|uniref:Uncharacterized protein n=1 Tax=Fusarium anthophilum TaxID=48485 RepID=A0A8H5E8B0_9HYPO|nr:hypothetical protein FANTH_4011 [Fusarium anthophilum]
MEEDLLSSLSPMAMAIVTGLLDANFISDDSSVQSSVKRSLKDPWGIFRRLQHFRDSPWEAEGTGLLILGAHIPPPYLNHEDNSDSETESDEMENESADGYEDYAEDESDNDGSMPSLDDLGFIGIQPQLDDAETEMLELIWSLTSRKRRYYEQEGLAILRRILATEGAKLFFIRSKRLSVRDQMLNAVASGLMPKRKQFIHLILVFWAKIEVIELADDLLQKGPSPEQQRILQFVANSEGLFNGMLLFLAVEKCRLTAQTLTLLLPYLDSFSLSYGRKLRTVTGTPSKFFRKSCRSRAIPTFYLRELLDNHKEELATLLPELLKSISQTEESQRCFGDTLEEGGYREKSDRKG